MKELSYWTWIRATMVGVPAIGRARNIDMFEIKAASIKLKQVLGEDHEGWK